MDYYHISAEDLGRDARVPLVCAADSAEVFFDLALEMVSTIREHNARGEKTVFICPVGPVGHYPYFVKMVNAYGGKMPDAIGIPEDELRRAAKMAVCKINIDSDIRLAMTAGIRRVLANNPSVFDPREYLKVGRDEVKKMVAHKIVDVLGSDNKM